MLLKLFIALAVLCPIPLAANAADDAKDADSIDGTWLPLAAELGGKPWPEEFRKITKLIVKDGKYAVTVGDAPPDKGTIKLNTSATPRELDTIGTEGPNKDKTIPAIYERDGDTLKICYDLSGKSRPKEFKTVAGSKLFLVTYKREKT